MDVDRAATRHSSPTLNHIPSDRVMDPEAPHAVRRRRSSGAEHMDAHRLLNKIDRERSLSTTGESPGIIYQGILWKRGHMRKNWKKRYFVLAWNFSRGFILSYYTVSSKGLQGKECKGSVRLGKRCTVRESDLRPYGFFIEEEAHEHSNLYLSARNEEERQAWMDVLAGCLRSITSQSYSVNGRSSTSTPIKVPPPPPPRPLGGQGGDGEHFSDNSSEEGVIDTGDPSTNRTEMRMRRSRTSTFREGIQDERIKKKYPSRVKVYVSHGENMDIQEDGEPVVQCQIGSARARTRVASVGNQLVSWRECIGPVKLSDSERYAIIYVVDEAGKQSGRKANEPRYVGRAVVPLSLAWYNSSPRWFPLCNVSSGKQDKLSVQGRIMLQFICEERVCPPLQASFEHIRSLQCLRPAILNPLHVCGMTDKSSHHHRRFDFAAKEMVEDACSGIMRPFSESSSGVFPGTLFLTNFRLLFIPSTFDLAHFDENWPESTSEWEQIKMDSTDKQSLSSGLNASYFAEKAETTFVTVDNQTGFQSHGLMMAFHIPLDLIKRVKVKHLASSSGNEAISEGDSNVKAVSPVLKIYARHFLLPRFTVQSDGICQEHDVARRFSGGITNGSQRLGTQSLKSAADACSRIAERLRYHLFASSEDEQLTVRPDISHCPSDPGLQSSGQSNDLPLSSFSHVYDIQREFDRQCISPRFWRLSYANRNYGICESYPPLLMVPSTVKDDDIRGSAQFRSRGRLPVLTWHHPANGAAILRSAQPLIGLRRKSCEEDEKLLHHAREASPHASERLVILDARAPLHAQANTALGKGTEKTGPGTGYPTCQLLYLNISNIHVIRKSLEQVNALLTKNHERIELHSAQKQASSSTDLLTATGTSERNKPTRQSLFDKLFRRKKKKKSSKSVSRSGGSFYTRGEVTAMDTAAEEDESDSDDEEDDESESEDEVDTTLRDSEVFHNTNPVAVAKRGSDASQVKPVDQSGGPRRSLQPLARGLSRLTREQRHNSVFAIKSNEGGLKPGRRSSRRSATKNKMTVLGTPVSRGPDSKKKTKKQRESGEWATAHMSVTKQRGVYTVERQAIEDDWAAQIANTGWFGHCALILTAATKVVRLIDECGTSVLIHCSDGWDRTSQISSLAQLMLDPYYRTIEGFAILVEKDWLSFGHKFRSRCGRDRQNQHEESPIFWQFLDCVYQLLDQFPSAFEFKSELLSTIAIHCHSKWFDNFLYDTPRERHEMRTQTSNTPTGRQSEREKKDECIQSPCLWKTLAKEKDMFVNNSYKRPPAATLWPIPLDQNSVRFSNGDTPEGQVYRRIWMRSLVLQAECSTRYFDLWRSFFLHFVNRVRCSLKYEAQWARPSAAYVPDEVIGNGIIAVARQSLPEESDEERSASSRRSQLVQKTLEKFRSRSGTENIRNPAAEVSQWR
eukprot:gb/GECG01008866.1/.p1 GENE.gb/GECG01008866.1/~~gb/GECG01008866.1/.p1  ORF type:complete len:1419 (+),score=156.48 gb/GECG01008866.1/:1-4257(+)